MNDIMIRKAEEKDAAALADLAARTFWDAFEPTHPRGDMEDYIRANFAAEVILEDLRDKNNIYLTARLEDRLCGYSKLARDSRPPELSGDGVIELKRLYVLQDLIGRKVGRALMLASLAEAGREGFRVIWLSTWEKNERALAFYGKFGFVPFAAGTVTLGSVTRQNVLLKREVPGPEERA
jgi:ribosomal protein S18 acetylase RimI-like enzyme